MEAAITAIGTANPVYSRNQMEAAELIAHQLNVNPAQKRLLRSVYKATGIDRRYSVLGDYCKSMGEFEFFSNNLQDPFPSTVARMQVYQKEALPLAIQAIKNCLMDVDEQSITHLITISCTGMYAPGIDIEIIQALGLNTKIQRTAINFMGCYAAFNGLKVAKAICESDPNAVVLMVCVELCSIHIQKNADLSNLVSNAIFSDGAAAVIVQSRLKNQKAFSLEYFYNDLLPQTHQEMAWYITDSGFDIVLSAYVPEIIKSGIHRFCQALLEKARYDFSQIDFYAIHPGGMKILQACEESLGITVDDNQHAYAILRDYGNMSSATILFVLKSIWDALKKEDDQKNIFGCAFGPGLTLESMLLKTCIPF